MRSQDSSKIKIVSETSNLEISIEDSGLSIESFSLEEAIIAKYSERKISNRLVRGTRTFYVSESYYFLNDIEHFISKHFFKIFSQVSDFIQDIHYLPASRSGLYQTLSAFGEIFAELSKNRGFLKKKVELPGLAEPLSDYFLALSEISPKTKDGRISKIGEKIEEEILNGNVVFDSRAKKIIYKPKEISLAIDISHTSSMVSEISPIVAYLKYIVKERKVNKRG